MNIKRWLPIALCCLPGVIIGVLLGVGASFLGNGRIVNVNPNSIFLLVMGLACPLGMGLMIWLMNRSMSDPSGHTAADKQKHIRPTERLAALREQRQLLEIEIAELSQLAELEAQRDALRNELLTTADGSPQTASEAQ